MDKGTFSNLVSASAFALGVALPRGPVQAAILSTGMFAFSGGITNSLAIKMLFDKVPGFIGSGVILDRFREILAKLKQLMLVNFFQPAYLRQFIAEERSRIDWAKYLKKGAGPSSPMARFVRKQWERLASPETIAPIVDKQLDKLTDSPAGGLLLMMGIDNVKPSVNRFVAGLLSSFQDQVVQFASKVDLEELEIEIDEEKLVEDVRAHAEALIDAKLEELNAQDVKRMMEDVIRNHLGWLVVWGNVFGAILGVLSLIIF